MNLKLFVWDELFSEYTNGIMIALAESKEEAMAIIIDRAEKDISGPLKGKYVDIIKEDLERCNPKVFYDKIGLFYMMEFNF